MLIPKPYVSGVRPISEFICNAAKLTFARSMVLRNSSASSGVSSRSLVFRIVAAAVGCKSGPLRANCSAGRLSDRTHQPASQETPPLVALISTSYDEQHGQSPAPLLRAD